MKSPSSSLILFIPLIDIKKWLLVLSANAKQYLSQLLIARCNVTVCINVTEHVPLSAPRLRLPGAATQLSLVWPQWATHRYWGEQRKWGPLGVWDRGLAAAARGAPLCLVPVPSTAFKL